MTILEFAADYPDESSCRKDFKAKREQQGIVCKKCDSTEHYWLAGKEQWECKSCHFRTTLRSGSMMQGSNLPVRTWYLAMAFMSFSKKGLSAKELQRQLNHSRYDTVWSLMHRIRNAMGNRDAMYKLEGTIEFDEAFFEIATSTGIKLKRGRGSQKQQNVAVMAESTPLEDIESAKQSKQCRYFKMKALQTHKSESVDQVVEQNIDQESIVFTDKATTYNLSHFVEAHMSGKSSDQTTKTTLKWVHIAIANAKRTFLGIYHRISAKYLQLYQDEFCYKLNRRYFGEKLFDRLAIAVAKSSW